MQSYVANPSSLLSSSAAAVPVDGPVRAGDVCEIVVGAPVPPIYSRVRVDDLGPHLLASGIGSNVAVDYLSGPPHTQGTGKLIIRGIVANDWRSGAELCGEVLKLVAATGYTVSPSNWLACTITPQAPASPSFEIPAWLILLLIAGGLWLLWKNSRG